MSKGLHCVSEVGCKNVRTTVWPECVDEQHQLNCVKPFCFPCAAFTVPAATANCLFLCFIFIGVAHFSFFFFFLQTHQCFAISLSNICSNFQQPSAECFKQNWSKVLLSFAFWKASQSSGSSRGSTWPNLNHLHLEYWQPPTGIQIPLTFPLTVTF